MKRCHYIKSEHYVDTGEIVHFYEYDDIKIKERIKIVYEIVKPHNKYEVLYKDNVCIFSTLEDACKFIEYLHIL